MAKKKKDKTTVIGYPDNNSKEFLKLKEIVEDGVWAKVFHDPAKLGELTKNQLAELNELTEYVLEELAAQRVAVRVELLDKIEGDGEVIAGKSYIKIKIYSFAIELKEAKELGATKIVPEKETIDNSALKKLLMRGAKIKHTIVERLMIREIKK